MDGRLLGALWKIIVANIVLSGDNAVVIAMACRNLSAKYRTARSSWAAPAPRPAHLFCAVIGLLLGVPYLKLVGGALLLWIGVKLMADEEGEADIKAHENLWAAIWTIVVADAVMSLDNAIAIAAAAKGNFTLIVIGLVISIPIIVFGATLISSCSTAFTGWAWWARADRLDRRRSDGGRRRRDVAGRRQACRDDRARHDPPGSTLTAACELSRRACSLIGLSWRAARHARKPGLIAGGDATRLLPPRGRRKTAPHLKKEVRDRGRAVVATRGAGALCHPAVAKPRPAASPSRKAPRRSPFQRDRDRIIHSTAFRRLKHKTQVFVDHEGDHYRTRLTHSLEVAQIARTSAARCASTKISPRPWRWPTTSATRRSAMPARRRCTPR